MLQNQDNPTPKTSHSALKHRTRLKGPPAEPGDSGDMPIDLCGSSTNKVPDIDSSHTEENNPPTQENAFKNTSPVKVSKSAKKPKDQTTSIRYVAIRSFGEFRRAVLVRRNEACKKKEKEQRTFGRSSETAKAHRG
eukprot:TRINITY_DN9768_c0_g1_i1.p1 TRINITY_DN9768_c0_g1~~TRINITY_DN9768_c0_g1_i1.p1  ORF type:complete len:136 (+),score=41.63 TRINITY_DN9768_c0_g1_i1:278-685(+)